MFSDMADNLAALDGNDSETVSPGSTASNRTIRDSACLFQSLSVDMSEFDPLTYQNHDTTEAKLVDISPEQKLCDFENLQITAEIGQGELKSVHNSEGHNQNGENSRPHSLSLPPPLKPSNGAVYKVVNQSQREKQKLSNNRGRTQSDVIIIPPTRKILENWDQEAGLSRSLPQGTILRKGDMIEFVADDLQEKIRRSSPMSKTGSSNSRRSSVKSTASFSSNNSAGTSMATSTASGWSRSPSSLFQQSPDDIPPIDPQAVMELENQARLVADNVDLMLGNLKSSLYKMSARSVECLGAYQDSVDLTCESVDTSIKSMYALMAKCEELSKTVEPVHQLAGQIKEIKRLLDLFEAHLSDKVPKTS